MAKQGAKTAVPRLRFPKFEGRPRWPLLKLGARGKFVGGGTPSRENAEFWAGANPWISSSDVSDEEIRSVKPSRFITDEAVAQSATQAVPAGSVLIVSRVGVGKVAVSEEQLYTSQDFANFYPSSDSPEFIAYLLKSRKSSLLAFNQGMAIKGFTRDDIAGLDVPIPSKPEQQEIADCLMSLDEVIAAQGRKVEALKAHKRGLMQQLFPREGEIRPRLRLPEFRDAPEWAEATIGSQSQSFSGGTPSTDDRSYYDGEIPFIRSAEIGSAFTELSLTELGLRNSAAKLVEPGDVLVALYGANSGDVALAKTSGAINQAILCVRPEGSKAYLYHFITARKEWIVATYLQGGQGNLSGEIVKSIRMQFPSFEEQQRIADCLSSLDTQIIAESAQLAALKTHKQGLMQNLFPVQSEQQR
ncbi:MAG TPA: restriction endonuclease subunit S [Luteimonas sp.]|nr:restriction endonuclease subunit S [Luteimonas sp.]